MISIVIPTRDRPERLALVLEGLRSQRAPAAGFEVLVVEDGRGEGAQLARGFARDFPAQLEVVDGPRRGPGSARNAGVAVAAGRTILFLGDDTVPESADLVERHCALHAAGSDGLGVLGRVVWGGGVTPFMRWLAASGIQFAFGELEAGPVDPARFFYSAHVSLPRAALLFVGGFDERFESAAGEDVELGARLADAGMSLEYHPELTVLHHHPTTLADSLSRMLRVGAAARLIEQSRPGHPDARPARALRWRAASAARGVLRAVEALPQPGATRAAVWRLLHLEAYGRGYRAAVGREKIR